MFGGLGLVTEKSLQIFVIFALAPRLVTSGTKPPDSAEAGVRSGRAKAVYGDQLHPVLSGDLAVAAFNQQNESQDQLNDWCSWYFWLTIQNTASRHVSNAFDLVAVFISFPLARAAARPHPTPPL